MALTNQQIKEAILSAGTISMRKVGGEIEDILEISTMWNDQLVSKSFNVPHTVYDMEALRVMTTKL